MRLNAAHKRTSNEKELSMHRQRDFLLLVTLAAATATSALGQTVAPLAAPAGSGTQSAASIPKFSGVWSHGFGFEPPASGPGPVTNRSRLPGSVGNINQLVGDYTNPILTPEAAEVVKRHGEISLSGVGYPTPSNQCWPHPVPYIFGSGNSGVQILQQADKITIIYYHDHQVRHVRMNEPHPAELTPSWYGDSVGHYEGDTLVIDTVGVKIGPFAMADWYGTPYTRALHVVERYRLLDFEAAKEGLERMAKENGFSRGLLDAIPNYRGKHLQLHFTVDDEGVFKMPWSATITYRPALYEWGEYVCAENIRGYSAGKGPPRAEKPDF
jgi:hypothetical protein